MAPSATLNGSADTPGIWLSNGDHDPELSSSGVLKTDILIIGAGPAGASLGCFLGEYGLRGIIISRAPGTADTPRAHITNMAALECLRDIGVDEDCIHVATDGDCMVHTRWCHSMAGQEYARIHSWGHGLNRKGDYEAASPCSPVDLPQTLLEPVLVRHAGLKGFKCRFDTSFLSFEDLGEKGVLTTVRDDLSGNEYKIHSKYLFGADGARSRVIKQLGLPLMQKPGGGEAINVLVKADLSHLIKYRKGNLHWIIQPDREHCLFGWMGIVRMVKAWHEWMFILFPKPGVEYPPPTQEEYLRQVRNFIGDDSIPAEIISVSKWNINEIVAEQYSQGNVFCLGDAVHRHPPFNGLGSNSCIQDAFNLAWKVAYVEAGLANRSLLSTYDVERQPVGHSVITRANDGFRDHRRIWSAIGILPDELEERKAILAELTTDSEAGKERRIALQEAILNTCHEFHGLGVEMNQTYTGEGIVADDEETPFQYEGPAATDPILYHYRSTYPGRRLPHAWLNKAIPEDRVSTIDLAGKGRFTLFTGIGGGVWKVAAAAVSKRLGLQIGVHSIGFGQDWEDPYFAWAQVRGVEESGAVLVRPDRFVAWRSPSAISDEGECEAKLEAVLRKVLSLK